MSRLRLKGDALWKCAILAATRALPFAFAFAPAMLMKRGLGVLLPAAVYPLPEIIMLPFQSKPLDIDDQKNLIPAATSFLVVWFLASFVLLVRQACKSRVNTNGVTKASQ